MKRTNELLRAKAALDRGGWSNRAAAKALGVCFQHLSAVLNGHRKSASLLAKIEALPAKEVAAPQP